jgi:hypothetical protein
MNARLPQTLALAKGDCPSVMQNIDSQLGQGRELLKANGVERLIMRSTGIAQSNQNLVVDLGLEFDDGDLPAPAAGARFAPIIGRIAWGQGSANFQAFVDYRQGVQLCVAASSIEVHASWEATTAPVYNRVICNAAISWGSRAGRSFVTRSLGPTAVANGATVVFPVPPFAYALIINATSANPLAGGVQQLGGPVAATDLVLRLDDVTFYSGATTGEGVKLHGWTRFVSFNNTNGVNTNIFPTFVLNL